MNQFSLQTKIRNTSLPRVILAISLVLVTSGCGKALEDFVRTNRPKFPTDVTDLASTNSIKISPGQTQATGTDVAMSAHVTITDRPLDGGDVSARVSVSRQRQE